MCFRVGEKLELSVLDSEPTWQAKHFQLSIIFLEKSLLLTMLDDTRLTRKRKDRSGRFKALTP